VGDLEGEGMKVKYTVVNLNNELTRAYAQGRHDGMVKARQEIYRVAQRQGWDRRIGAAWKTLDDMIREKNKEVD
jgi:hypothetical protein